MKFEVYKGNNDEHYFRLIDSKNRVLISGEGYKQKENMLNGIESIKKNLPLSTGAEKKESTNGKHYFNVKSANGQIVGTSALFESKAQRDKLIIEIEKELPEVLVIDALK
jgi:uncharacterized protein YegP (UPF0339 family)